MLKWVFGIPLITYLLATEYADASHWKMFKGLSRQSQLQQLVFLCSCFYRSFRYFISKSCKMLHSPSIHAVPGFWCAPARICLCLAVRMWFIVRLVGVEARAAVMFFLCSLSCAAAVLSSLLYVHPDMHPQASMPFIISFETFIWSLRGISPLDSWHSQWKRSLIYRKAYSQKSRAQPSLCRSMRNNGFTQAGCALLCFWSFINPFWINYPRTNPFDCLYRTKANKLKDFMDYPCTY